MDKMISLPALHRCPACLERGHSIVFKKVNGVSTCPTCGKPEPSEEYSEEEAPEEEAPEEDSSE